MKMRKTDMAIDGRMAHGTGEAIKKEREEMRGTGRGEWKERRW